MNWEMEVKLFCRVLAPWADIWGRNGSGVFDTPKWKMVATLFCHILRYFPTLQYRHTKFLIYVRIFAVGHFTTWIDTKELNFHSVQFRQKNRQFRHVSTSSWINNHKSGYNELAVWTFTDSGDSGQLQYKLSFTGEFTQRRYIICL